MLLKKIKLWEFPFPIGTLILIIAAIFLYIIIPLHPVDTNEDTVTRLYYADNISEAHQKLIDIFNKRHKDEIEVVAINLPFEKFSTNERKELLVRSLRSKSDKIDIFSVDYIWVARFSKWSEPLTHYYTAEERSRFLDYALESCVIDSQLVAVPLYVDVGLMYYRKDKVRELAGSGEIIKKLKESMSWDDFIELSGRFNTENYYIFQADDYEGLICSLTEMILSLDPGFFDNQDIDLRSPAVRESLTLLKNLPGRYNISPEKVTEFKEDRSYKYFFENDALFLRAWPGFEITYKQYFSENDSGILLDVAALPHMTGGDTVSIYGGWNLMISRFTDKKNEAVKFLKFITSREAQKIMYEEGRYLPVLSSIYTDATYLEKHPELNYKKVLLDRGVHRPFFDDYTRISDIISYYARLAITGQKSVGQALDEAQSYIDEDKIIIK